MVLGHPWELAWEKGAFLVGISTSFWGPVYLLGYVVPRPPGPEYGVSHILFIGIDRIIDYMGITSCVLSDVRKEIGF